MDEIEAIFQPRWYDGAKEETRLEATGELTTILRICHLDNVARSSGLHKNGPQAEDESSGHQHMQGRAGSLQDGANNTYKWSDCHPDLTPVRISTGAGKEGTSYIADDIERSDKPLVLCRNAEVIYERRNSRQTTCYRSRNSELEYG